MTVTLRFSRIVAVLDSAPEGVRALEAAMALAASLQRPVEAVFIEDADLLSLAALPFSREVALSGRPAAPFEPARVARELHLRARMLRERAERLAGAHQLQCSFRVVRGRRAEELRRLRQAGDLLALGVAEATGIEGAALLAGPACALQPGPVVLLLGATPERETLELAEALAQAAGQPLRLLSGSPGLRLPGRTVEPLAPDALGASLQRLHAGLLVARAGDLPDGPARLARRLRVPLLVV